MPSAGPANIGARNASGPPSCRLWYDPPRQPTYTVHRFVDWLAQTSLSLAIQTNEWVIPTVQSIHIVAIGVALGSVFMVTLRILGWAGRDESLARMNARFGPWLTWALVVLLTTGIIMIVGEPARELLTLSFWLKMILIAIGTAIAVAFQRAVRRHQEQWDATAGTAGVRVLAVVTLLIWLAIVVLGRLIAYDRVWGSWSAWMRA